MPGPLHRVERRILGGEDVLLRMGLVRPVDLARAGEGDGMIVAGAALGGQQVIPGPPVLARALVEMRAFDQLQVGSLVDVPDRPDELSLCVVVFLERDAGEQQRPGPMVPQHVDEPLPAVVVMEQRRVEPRGIHVDRVGPGPFDRGRGDEVVMRVLERAVLALHVGVDEEELLAVMAEAGRPHPARIRIAAHVELRFAAQRPGHQLPVGEIPGVMDLHPRVPLEGGGGDVIVVPDAQDRRVGVEAGEDGVADGGHAYTRCLSRDHLPL